MNKHTMAVTTMVLMLAAAAATPAHAQNAVSNDVFSLAVPAGYAAFTKQVQTTDAPEGKIETTNWIAKAPTGEAVIVTMSRMPGKVLDPQKLMASTRDSLLKTLHATLESEEPRPGETPSSRLLFQGKGAWFRARLMVIDDRFYQLLYVGRSDAQRNAPAVRQMFDSFRIAQAAQTAPAS